MKYELSFPIKYFVSWLITYLIPSIVIMLMKNWWVSRDKNRSIGWFVTSMQSEKINPDLMKIFVSIKNLTYFPPSFLKFALA